MTDSKICPHCGKQFTRNPKEQGPKAWARRVHCSTSCRNDARRKPEDSVKICPHCGAEFEKTSSFSAINWARRRYCSTQCGARARYGHPPIAPDANARRCECGNPATTTIRFHIMMASDLLESSLQVCEDCYQYMRENDRGTW
jgi:hypothetical protein